MIGQRFGTLVFVTLIGCTMHPDSDAAMDLQTGVLVAHTNDMDRLADAHASAISAARTLEDVRNEEAAYQASMKLHLDDSEHERADMMSYCHHRSTGLGPGTAEIQQALDAIRNESEQHAQMTRQAATLDAARAEEGRHRASMREMTGKMAEVLREMRASSGWYRCSMHLH